MSNAVWHDISHTHGSVWNYDGIITTHSKAALSIQENVNYILAIRLQVAGGFGRFITAQSIILR